MLSNLYPPSPCMCLTSAYRLLILSKNAPLLSFLSISISPSLLPSSLFSTATFLTVHWKHKCIAESMVRVVPDLYLIQNPAQTTAVHTHAHFSLRIPKMIISVTLYINPTEFTMDFLFKSKREG